MYCWCQGMRAYHCHWHVSRTASYSKRFRHERLLNRNGLITTWGIHIWVKIRKDFCFTALYLKLRKWSFISWKVFVFPVSVRWAFYRKTTEINLENSVNEWQRPPWYMNRWNSATHKLRFHQQKIQGQRTAPPPLFHWQVISVNLQIK